MGVAINQRRCDKLPTERVTVGTVMFFGALRRWPDPRNKAVFNHDLRIADQATRGFPLDHGRDGYIRDHSFGRHRNSLHKDVLNKIKYIHNKVNGVVKMQYIHAKQALTQDGWETDIQIDIRPDGRISRVGRQDSVATHRLDLALPAPTNLHSHAFQRAMAGLTEARGPDPRDSFWTWRRLM